MSGLERLRAQFEEMGSVLVAFSGGIDSALVLRVAHDVLGDRAVALTALGPALAQWERQDAERIARDIGARHLFRDSAEMGDAGYRRNTGDRCFYCKGELYRIAQGVRAELGLSWVANGTNVDDLDDYRPGLRAAEEAGIRSPLVDAKLTKAGVRELARALQMPDWDKPAAPCLASRIPHGTEVTPERIAQVEALEGALHKLGLRELRVRHHGELARVEVAPNELDQAFTLRQEMTRAGKRAGFAFVTLDLEGYRQGSLNVTLPIVH